MNEASYIRKVISTHEPLIEHGAAPLVHCGVRAEHENIVVQFMHTVLFAFNS